MRRISPTVYALLLLLTFTAAKSETIVVAVEDKDWTPYYTWIDGEPRGPCPEIAAGAIRHMDAEVEFARYPWIRVLQSVERQKVDAGLCGTKTDERAVYSFYPDEPLLNFDATLFVATDSSLQSSELAGLGGKTFGMLKGYAYAGVDEKLENSGMTRVEANTRESLLKLLVLGRVDAILDSVLPTVFEARQLGFADQVRPLLPSLAETPGYLMFSQKPGHDELARRFSAALRDYKTTPEYAEIQQRYGF